MFLLHAGRLQNIATLLVAAASCKTYWIAHASPQPTRPWPPAADTSRNWPNNVIQLGKKKHSVTGTHNMQLHTSANVFYLLMLARHSTNTMQYTKHHRLEKAHMPGSCISHCTCLNACNAQHVIHATIFSS